MIELKNITKKYGSLEAVKPISWEINQGTLSCLVGPNGSGKSTLIKIILGLNSPSSGTLTLSGKSKIMGYMPEVINFPDGSTAEFMLNAVKRLSNNKTKITDEIVAVMGMQDYMKKRIKKLSKGMQKKIGLLLAFANDPDFVILDEPFEGIDTIDRDKLLDFLGQKVASGKTIIISTHILHELDKLTDNALFLKNGDLVFHKNKLVDNWSLNKEVLPLELAEEVEEYLANQSEPTISDLYRIIYR